MINAAIKMDAESKGGRVGGNKCTTSAGEEEADLEERKSQKATSKQRKTFKTSAREVQQRCSLCTVADTFHKGHLLPPGL